jgi:ADP-heptose:LPS heptosyltransferase
LNTHSINEDRQKVKLAVRLPNWIGDALMSFPMLKALEQSGIDFTCIGHPWAQDLFSGMNFKIIAHPDVKKIKWAYRIYKENKFNHGIVCPSTFSATLPMRMARLKTVGYHGLSGFRPKYDDTLHTVENYFELARPFIEAESSISAFEDKIDVDPESEAESETIIKIKLVLNSL